MILLTFAAMAVALTIAAFWLKNIILGMTSTFSWLLVAGYSFSTMTGTADPIFYSFLFGIAMTITMPIATFELYHRSKEEQADWSEDREWKHKERNEPKVSLIGAADRLRLKHGMGLSATRRRHEINKDTGWD